MSNPDPNLPPRLGREGRRHIGPLVGMAAVVIFGLAMIFWWLTETAVQAPGPGQGPGMTQEEMMAPPASPLQGGDASGPATGTTGGGTDAVGAPTPGPDTPLGTVGDGPTILPREPDQ